MKLFELIRHDHALYSCSGWNIDEEARDGLGLLAEWSSQGKRAARDDMSNLRQAREEGRCLFPDASTYVNTAVNAKWTGIMGLS